MRTLSFLFCCSLALTWISCDNEPAFEVPDSYNFDNVDISVQTQTLGMLTELATYAKSANSPGITLNGNRLAAMYANQAPAAWAGNYDDNLQLRNQTFTVEQGLFDNLLDELAGASQSSATAQPGTAGIATTNDGTKSYFVSASGVEYAQVIEKGLMGALLYYQGVNEFLGADRQNVDNETVVPGEGTAMEHAWDQAFGYWGVPRNFPADQDGLAFWGKYTNDRNPILGSNETLMNAFLRGRAAISNDALAERNSALETIRDEWELVSVATALHYLNQAIDKYDDVAVRLHALSEAAAFVYTLKFNTARGTSIDNIDQLLETIGGSRNFRQMNFYDVSAAELEAARDQLADYYNLTDRKTEF